MQPGAGCRFCRCPAPGFFVFIKIAEGHHKRFAEISCGSGGYTDPDDQEWMYAETWLHEDGFEDKNLADIKAYIHETRKQGLILGDKYISHDLVPSFYLVEE